MKVLTAEKVKRLKPGTDVFVVNEATGERGMLRIVKSGREKVLQGVFARYEIRDLPGTHYEVEDKK